MYMLNVSHQRLIFVLLENITLFHGLIWIVQSNFNGSDTFGTMKICPRQGLFEPMRVDYSARSGGILGIIFRFSLT